jgi:hypothetical protein
MSSVPKTPDRMTDETRIKVLKCPLMGRARALEKATVHYGGDVSRIVDLARNAMVFQSLDDLNAAVDAIKSKHKIVRIRDRIAEPTEMGYRDIALNVQTSNDQIATMRLLSGPILEAKNQGHKLYAERQSILAAALRRGRSSAEEGESYAVAVLDMFNYMDDEGAMLVDGFPSAEIAKEYARRRMRDSVEELRAPDQSREELKQLWFVFGEDSLVVGGERSDAYYGLADLDFFIDHPASTAERDWLELERRFPVHAEPLPP